MEFCYYYQNQFKSNEYVPAHSHNCYELIFYPDSNGALSLSSSYTYTQSNFQIESNIEKQTYNKTIKFSPLSLIVLPPSLLHNEIHKKNGSTISIGFCLNKTEKQRFNGVFSSLFNNLNNNLTSLIQNIQLEFQEQLPYFDTNITAYLLQILVNLSRQKKQSSNSVDINYFLSFINENYMLDINIEELAKEAGYSPSQFRNLFNKHTGLSPKAYLIQKRINAAKQLLLNKDLPVSEIAKRCGYENIYDFSAIFKKHLGISPTDYRNS